MWLQCNLIKVMVTTSRDGMGWEVGGKFKKEGTYVYVWYVYVWFMVMYGRNEHNAVKELSFN